MNKINSCFPYTCCIMYNVYTMYIVEDFTGKINIYKGTVSRDFLLQVFFINHLPQAPENNIRIISIFFITGTGCTTGINDSGCAP
jgi:hypothetical protein